jgi:enterochelin esterase-like enzyme
MFEILPYVRAQFQLFSWAVTSLCLVIGTSVN